MIRLTRLLNEVKENRIYATGLGILVEKVCVFLKDEEKVKLLAAWKEFESLATKINETPYGLFTSESVGGQIFMLGLSVQNLKSQLVELAETYTKREHLDVLKCAIRSTEEILDY